jgi:catechol 2,3-dioxygenase-like lactoylglutathione lyase family enzyme
MFDHVKFEATDYEASKTFFLAALAPLGVRVISEGDPLYGVEMSGGGEASLCITQTSGTPSPIHIAFTAISREQVNAFYHAALAAGERTTDHPASASVTARHITPPLSLRRTATI